MGSLVGLIITIFLSYQGKFFWVMFFQWFFRTLSSFFHDSTPSLSTQETKPLPPPPKITTNPKHLCRYWIKCLLNVKLVFIVCISPIIYIFRRMKKLIDKSLRTNH